jgi:hypothetical protein
MCETIETMNECFKALMIEKKTLSELANMIQVFVCACKEFVRQET